jgi:hypothetical protein
MGVMQMQLWDMTLEQDALCEELATCQAKFLGLKQNVAIQYKHCNKHSQGPLRRKKNA